MYIVVLVSIVLVFFISSSCDAYISYNYLSLSRTSNRRSYLEMNMFDRFARVVSSNINNVIKGLEDPEKILDQAVNDMQKDLIKIRQSYAEVSATNKRMQNQKDNADKLAAVSTYAFIHRTTSFLVSLKCITATIIVICVAADWYRRAQLALQANDEGLAREALTRRQSQTEISETLGKQIALQSGAVEKLYSSMMTLDTKISEAKRQKDTFIARAQTAKTTVQVNDMLNSMLGGAGSLASNSMDAFERMKTKVEALESQAEVSGELAASSSGTSLGLEDKFRQLEGNTRVDDELAMMRKQLPAGQKDIIGQLPSQKSTFVVPENKAQLDAEYEKLKRELGK